MTASPSPIDFKDAVVHQATGMVAVQLACSIDDAFRALIDTAAERSRSVSELAREIVDRTTRLTPEPVGSVDLVRTDGTAVIYLRGEVDMALAGQLRDAITQGLRGRRLVVDLTNATFIDSTVIGALAAAHGEAAGTGVELAIGPGPRNVMRTLSLSGLDGLFASAGAAGAARRLEGDDGQSSANWDQYRTG